MDGWTHLYTEITSSGTMSGERGDVDNNVVGEWKNKLQTLCENYHPKDIFNMDETGLFFKDTYKKTFHFKGTDCAGGKMSKERITVALCSSMMGEKIKPLVIGKSRQPRCFNKIYPKTLPVTYRNNKKAWMNSNVYEDYLKTLDRQMRRQNRHILFFVDNAPSHPAVKLTNINVKFLPPNTTSKTQPMDQGIIQATKLKFKKRQLTHMVAQMEKQPHACGSTLLKQITILDAIYWISNAWNKVEESTILKCFINSGFKLPPEKNDDFVCDDDDNDCNDQDDNIPLAVIKLSRDIFGCDFSELIDIDKSLSTCDNANIDWEKPATDLIQDLNGCESEDSDDDETVCDSANVEKHIPKLEASDMMMKLKQFAKQIGSANIYNHISKAEDELNALMFTQCKQTDIGDFLVERPQS